jgi:UDP-3-O-[3-hydroxymyristoyl] glucosamine N-acyltransferase
LTLSELQSSLGGELRGDGDPVLAGVGSLEQAQPDQLSFVVNPKFAKTAQASQAGALIIPARLAETFAKPCLAVTNPHAAFAQAVALFHPEPVSPPGIDPAARLASDSQVDPTASIGPGVVIGPGAVVGPRTRIDPGCVIGADVHIGADCRLYPNVTIYHASQLGDRVIIHAGTVIGSDGFGLAWENDRWLKVPQVGRVLIGNDVEIGANTTIDRGALDDTVIEDGVKIDNLVQIAHNCRIGAHTAIAGCAGLAGSTTIGKNCLIGGAAMILGHIVIGDRVTVSGASFIGKSIREPGVYTSTQPQMPHDEWLKNAAQLRHLSDMRDRIRALEKKLSEFEGKQS